MRRLIVIALFPAAIALGDECVRSSGLSCPSNTIAASITTSDCAASDASGYDLWQFSGQSGDTITIDMTSSSFDTYLVLLDPNDTPVAENDDASSSTTNSRIGFTLTSTGAWTIVANALAANTSGDYTLSISCPLTMAPIRRRAANH